MNRKISFDFGKKKKIARERRKFLAKGLAIGAAAGSALGALSGILFAPKSGKETRQQIKDEVSEAAKKAADEVKVVSEKAAVGIKEVSEKAAVGIKEVSEKVNLGIKDLATKANEIVSEKMNFKKETNSLEEVAAATEDSDTEIDTEEAEKTEV